MDKENSKNLTFQGIALYNPNDYLSETSQTSWEIVASSKWERQHFIQEKVVPVEPTTSTHLPKEFSSTLIFIPPKKKGKFHLDINNNSTSTFGSKFANASSANHASRSIIQKGPRKNTSVPSTTTTAAFSASGTQMFSDEALEIPKAQFPTPRYFAIYTSKKLLRRAARLEVTKNGKKLLHPLYKLPRRGDIQQNFSVFLLESAYNSELELQLIEIDEIMREHPPEKRIKLDYVFCKGISPKHSQEMKDGGDVNRDHLKKEASLKVIFHEPQHKMYTSVDGEDSSETDEEMLPYGDDEVNIFENCPDQEEDMEEQSSNAEFSDIEKEASLADIELRQKQLDILNTKEELEDLIKIQKQRLPVIQVAIYRNETNVRIETDFENGRNEKYKYNFLDNGTLSQRSVKSRDRGRSRCKSMDKFYRKYSDEIREEHLDVNNNNSNVFEHSLEEITAESSTDTFPTSEVESIPSKSSSLFCKRIISRASTEYEEAKSQAVASTRMTASEGDLPRSMVEKIEISVRDDDDNVATTSETKESIIQKSDSFKDVSVKTQNKNNFRKKMKGFFQKLFKKNNSSEANPIVEEKPDAALEKNIESRLGPKHVDSIMIMREKRLQLLSDTQKLCQDCTKTYNHIISPNGEETPNMFACWNFADGLDFSSLALNEESFMGLGYKSTVSESVILPAISERKRRLNQSLLYDKSFHQVVKAEVIPPKSETCKLKGILKKR